MDLDRQAFEAGTQGGKSVSNTGLTLEQLDAIIDKLGPRDNPLPYERPTSSPRFFPVDVPIPDGRFFIDIAKWEKCVCSLLWFRRPRTWWLRRRRVYTYDGMYIIKSPHLVTLRPVEPGRMDTQHSDTNGDVVTGMWMDEVGDWPENLGPGWRPDL